MGESTHLPAADTAAEDMACPQSKGDLLLRRNVFVAVFTQGNDHRRFLAYAQLDLLCDRATVTTDHPDTDERSLGKASGL